MNRIKKFLRNRKMAYVSFTIFLSLAYIGVRGLINNYNFNHGEDISTIDINMSNNSNKTKVENSKEKNIETDDGITNNLIDENGKIVDEEIDFNVEDEKFNESVNSKEDNYEKIYVYITGEVNTPGVVILKEGSRIADAINAADGVTEYANISKVNLVYVLEDGMKVNIPNDNDLNNNSNFEYITMDSGDGSINNYINKSSLNESGNNYKSNEVNGNSSSSGDKKHYTVNINYATQTELETLPGIGPSLALKIINYRKENGKFSSIEQIKEISGIGESKFENLKELITI